MWKRINKQYFIQDSFDISTFRSPGRLNSRLASWEPNEKSLRWYRTFVNLAFDSSTDQTKELMWKMRGQMELGSPITNTSNYKSRRIVHNLDYLIAIEEFFYLKNYLILGDELNILEVGAGFGRTAHVILEEMPKVKKYFIFDLPEMLKVSSEYLRNVLSIELYKKLRFISEISEIKNQVFSLGMQIDGFQEMSTHVIDDIYLKLLANCELVYLKNPVGKYLPSSGGLSVKPTQAPLGLGRSLDILDIWNPADAEHLFLKHVEVYKPSSHKVLDYSPERLFPHYLNIVYKKA